MMLRRYHERPAVEETRGRDADNKQEHPAPADTKSTGRTSARSRTSKTKQEG